MEKRLSKQKLIYKSDDLPGFETNELLHLTSLNIISNVESLATKMINSLADL